MPDPRPETLDRKALEKLLSDPRFLLERRLLTAEERLARWPDHMGHSKTWPDCGGCMARLAESALKDLLAAEQRAEEAERELREEWWRNHGHDYHALYGDDGELQCQACPADFKRQPLDELRRLVLIARAEHASTALLAPHKAAEEESK